MAVKKQNKKVAKKISKKSTTHKKPASSVKGKKSKTKTLGKSSKKSSAKAQKHQTSKGKSLKTINKNAKASKQKKSSLKTTSNKTGSVLGKIQKQMVSLKKKVQDSLVTTPSLKKKSETAKSQLQKKTSQKQVTKKSQPLKEKPQKSTTPPSSTKSSQATSAESLKIQTKTPVPLQSTGKKPNAAQKTVQKRSPATNKLDIAKKELSMILEREKEEKLILKDMEGRSYCCVEDCGFSAEVEGYCRLHYLGHWEYIIKRNKILKKEILEKLINQLISDHSQSILNYLLQDLKQDKTFTSTVKTLLEDDEDIESEDALLN